MSVKLHTDIGAELKQFIGSPRFHSIFDLEQVCTYCLVSALALLTLFCFRVLYSVVLAFHVVVP